MKLSQFTIFIRDYPQAGHHLVYNILTRSLIEIGDQCLSMLYSLHKEKPPAFAEPIIQKLQSQGFIVEDEQDEADSFNHVFSAQRSKQKELHAVILTTLECPMNCVYCYQKHIKNGGSMSDETMEKVVHWLKGQIQKREAERCFITFYGGEPLMNMTCINYISNNMSAYCKSAGVKLGLSMVTSGILATQDVAKVLKRIGVKYLQITLDGDKDVHDRRRPKKDGSGTFNLIMNNLHHLAKDFLVTINCNVDKENKDAAYRLIDTLVSQGYVGKIKGLVFGPVSGDYEQALKQHIACPMTNVEDLIPLNIYAAERGFASDLRPEHIICGMLLSSHFVIDPDGKLYTCPAFLGRGEFQVGNVDHVNNDDMLGLEGFRLKDGCLRCPYVPICGGGCRYNAFIEQGDIQAESCRKDMFSHSLPLLIRTHYALRNKHV
jgi:uncharacterized protein